MKKNKTSKESWHPPYTVGSPAKGFALVVALAMMAFMLLLLVALASLVSVESGRSQGELDQFAARQNALLGLRIAVAHLQSQTGDDRSSTAPAQASGALRSQFDGTGSSLWCTEYR